MLNILYLENMKAEGNAIEYVSEYVVMILDKY